MEIETKLQNLSETDIIIIVFICKTILVEIKLSRNGIFIYTCIYIYIFINSIHTD